MKLVTIVRTRDNINDIERFVRCYQWTDAILIADGGSRDGTPEVARTLPKTQVAEFNERVFSPSKRFWRNPTGKHINFLIRWAVSEKADWIIFDDCDCVPNKKVQQDGRDFFKSLPYKWEYVSINRVYVYGHNQYFEDLTRPDGTWTTGMWAWRANLPIWASENDPWTEEFDLAGYKEFHLLPPFCLMHYFYPDQATMQRKLMFYRDCELPVKRDPLEYGGRLLPLEKWMVI